MEDHLRRRQAAAARQFCGGHKATWCKAGLLKRDGDSGPVRRGCVQASDMRRELRVVCLQRCVCVAQELEEEDCRSW
jgi:hypothetical protein